MSRDKERIRQMLEDLVDDIEAEQDLFSPSELGLDPEDDPELYPTLDSFRRFRRLLCRLSDSRNP